MKYLIFLFALLAHVSYGQTFVLSNETDTQVISIISEGDSNTRYFDCAFEQVFQLEQLGYQFTEQDELINADWYLQGYLAYSYLRMGVDFEWVNNHIEFDDEFYPTLYLIGCKGYTYNFEK